MEGSPQTDKRVLENERWELLRQLEEWLETPMVVLGFVWLALLVVEFTGGLTPLLETVGLAIWGIFVLDFALRFALAPDKPAYFKSEWLTALALLLPALRIVRVARVLRLLRAARAARGLRLFRLVSSLNRGMRALHTTLGRRGFGYVVALSAVVTLAGAAGMYAFESTAPSAGGLNTYGAALWWTAMLMTTLGSDYSPRTDEGRVLCFLLALYAFGVFGYVTAAVATFFVGRDAESAEGELAGARSIEALRQEIAGLRAEIRGRNDPHPPRSAPKDAE